MTLWVRSCGAYRSDVESEWRDKDFLVRNLVKSLKGETFKGYTDIKVGAKSSRISAKDPAPALDWWSYWASKCIESHLGLGKVILVPVPSSSQTQFAQDTCPTRMAKSIVDRDPSLAVLGTFLRHKSKQERSHSEGGTRDPDKIARTLDCKITDASRPIVLIDDVLTSGGHLKACARILRANGVVVEHALVAGRAVRGEIPNPLKVPIEDIEAE